LGTTPHFGDKVVLAEAPSPLGIVAV
jgi:hypothetical protein